MSTNPDSQLVCPKAPFDSQKMGRCKQYLQKVAKPFQGFTRKVKQCCEHRGYSGWRFGVLLGLCISVLVSCLNLAILLSGAFLNGGYVNGFARVLRGSELFIERYNTAYHIVVNILSTLLLSASGYTMQVLNSPTREEVDRAHATGEAVDIGVLSLRNLGYVSKKRRILWFLLGISSISLHLTYNSIFFSVHVGHDSTADNGSDQLSYLNLSLALILTVIVANFLKVLVMLIVLRERETQYLVTVGDSVASFLANPDATTRRLSNKSKEEIKWYTEAPDPIKKAFNEDETPNSGTIWRAEKRTYGSVIGVAGRVLTIVICLSVTAFVFAFSFVVVGFTSPEGGWNLQTQVSMNDRSLALIVTANSGQLLLSSGYYVLNGWLTRVVSALEWDRQALYRKGLRVTQPEGDQRSTFFLQLPFRFAIPFAAVSCMCHWLMSQAVVFDRTEALDAHGAFSSNGETQNGLGVSPIWWLSAVSVYGALYLSAFVAAFFSWKINMPFVGCGSLGISAACHPGPQEVDPHLKKVQWGVLPSTEGELQHCALSSGPVVAPQDGIRYL